MSAGAGLTVVFQSHNRRGLGHLMRGLNIAREVLALRPDARVVMHTRNASAPTFCPDGVTCVVDADDPVTGWRRTLAGLAPDVVVYDTMAPADPDAEPVPPGARVVHVLRKMVPEEHDRILASGFLERCDAVVVPHTEAEFGLPLPERVRLRTVFAGTISRRPEPAGIEAVRARYAVRPGVPLLVSTAGGGGFADTAVPFFAAVRATHAELVRRLRPDGVQHVVVLGPNYAGEVPDLPGAHVVSVEPRLVDLFAIADLVLSEAGYNSVSELRLLGVPAVFVPGRRRLDDQAERALELARAGSAVVLDPAPTTVATGVADLLTDPDLMARMRRTALATRLVPGNRAAARHVLGLLALGGAA
ncbi:glycosyltransferase [Kineosporia sp. A_224]|uniref:glycosyltransferase n=1 Tax=Kineosporia sp. A_224 TaxID=1962180 RepID=UPI000B4ACA85|nr:glycosyltransferase [Kineosporia sp. A_224]